jgi:carbon-monoxide dehydrogenase iron sulfur subunit
VQHSGYANLLDALEDRASLQPRVRVEAVGDVSVPLQCRHCEDAPCIQVCPTNAIEQQSSEGPVLVNDALCIGCKFCILACPFGVLGIGHKGRAATKCDLCADRLQENLSPACVEACPTKALRFVPVEELTKERMRAFAETLVEGLEERPAQPGRVP